MKNYIGQLAILVDDYDKAIAYYQKVLDFKLIEDTYLSETKRWVVVEPADAGDKGRQLLLAKASNELQKNCIGNQSGGRVFLFLYTEEFERMHSRLIENKVEIVNGPRLENYGQVLVFKDLYGNLWDLIQRNE